MGTDNALKGIGGAPTRATTLPEGAKERKQYPIASGVLDYFPDAIAAVSRVSWQGNEQHNPGQPLHWARGKSRDHADTLMRHFLQRGTIDTDGQRHTAKVVWRALAMLQEEIEEDQTRVAEAKNAQSVPLLRADKRYGLYNGTIKEVGPGAFISDRGDDDPCPPAPAAALKPAA